MIIGPILITLLGWQVAVEAVQCGADVEDLVRHLSPKLSSPETLLTRCSAPAAFGRAVQGWNAPGDPRDYGQAPALVVRPTGVEDVVATVNFAVTSNLPLATKGGGHSFRGLFIADGGITIDMSRMKAIKVDPLSKLVIVEGGVTYADIAAATQPHDLAVPWGDVYGTGLGLALGGGIGYLSRAYGLATDQIINGTVVLANGTVVSANSTHNEELLKALRGAGTIFGVVTELTLKLHNISGLYGGHVVAIDDGNGSSFKAAHHWAAQAMAMEPQLGVEIFEFSDLGGTGQLGVLIVVAIPKEAAINDKDDLVAPLSRLPNIINNTLGHLDWWEVEALISDALVDSPYGAIYFVSGIATFEQADDDFMDLMFNLTTDLPEGIKGAWLADYLGNNVADNAVKSTASYTPFAGKVDIHFIIWYGWPAGVRNAENTAFAEKRRQQFAGKVLSTQAYANLATVLTGDFLEVQVGGADNLRVLRSLKAELDPTNLFQRHPFVGLYTDDMGRCNSESQL